MVHTSCSILVHLSVGFRMGGILPPLARDLHAQNISGVVNDALAQAGIQLNVCINSSFRPHCIINLTSIFHMCIHVKSPGFAGGILEISQISRSPVRENKSI